MLDLIDGLVRNFNKSLIISTHLLDDIQQTCEYVVMIERGQVLFSGPLVELMRYEQPRYRLRWEGDGAGLLEALRQADIRVLPDPRGLPYQAEGQRDGEVRVAVSPGFDVREFFRLASESGIRLRTLEPSHDDLSDLYHRLLAEGAAQ